MDNANEWNSCHNLLPNAILIFMRAKLLCQIMLQLVTLQVNTRENKDTSRNVPKNTLYWYCIN